MLLFPELDFILRQWFAFIYKVGYGSEEEGAAGVYGPILQP